MLLTRAPAPALQLLGSCLWPVSPPVSQPDVHTGPHGTSDPSGQRPDLCVRLPAAGAPSLPAWRAVAPGSWSAPHPPALHQ